MSTSIPQSEWDSALALHSSAEYHVNNLVSPVLFQEGLSLVPDNAVVLEIAPHALLQVCYQCCVCVCVSASTHSVQQPLLSEAHKHNDIHRLSKLFSTHTCPDVTG